MKMIVLYICWMTMLVSTFAQDDLPSSVFYSPTRKYSVKIDAKDYNEGGRFLILKLGGQDIFRVKTEGYIKEVYWSPNGKYVAVNNRNAESGDYLWIISLIQGTIIKKPSDPLPQVDTTKKYPDKYPEYNHYELYKQWVFAKGWNDKNELIVCEDDVYRNISDYLSTEIIYSIKNDKLVFIDQHTEKRKR